MNKDVLTHDVIVVGGGASGLMCAISAGYRGLRVLLLEQGPKVGLKILVSGGGRCNFTNLFADPREHYLSENPNFCISAMKRFSPSDFIQMVETAGIDYHEKKLGQLFCDNSAKEIVAMLLQQCAYAGVEVRLRQEVESISPNEGHGFGVATNDNQYLANKVVIASGGLSMPKIASDLAFRTAKDLGLKLHTLRAALVPLTWNSSDKVSYEPLSGISTEVVASCGGESFRENLLFTHRGLSGPAILQISSFWREGLPVDINLLPDIDAPAWLIMAREANPQQRLVALLKMHLPKRLVELMSDSWFEDQKVGSFSPPELTAIGERLNSWSFMPGGSEGYRTAEVTLGGIDTDEVSSKTFELKRVPGMFAVGEALDVTGWLGGYNFQWAWASGWCCGQHL
ncbi:MAG: putative Rossmann fold flavoprotein [Glaciecola sp.]|jgi:predicted Rossmann fold flavoprotein